MSKKKIGRKKQMLTDLKGIKVLEQDDYIAYSKVLPPVPLWVYLGIVENFKETRERAGLSRAQLGAMIGAEETTVAAFESGRRFLCDHRLERLVQVLCIKIVTNIKELETMTLSAEKGDTVIVCDPALYGGESLFSA
jgi:DNA-binding XRE family transcriptional regulator